MARFREYHMTVRYKVELRKPKSVTAKQWTESFTFDTEQEATDRIGWWLQYDLYYSLEGWEYRIVEVKGKKR